MEEMSEEMFVNQSDDDKMAKWEAEFNQLMSQQRDDMDYATEIENAYQTAAAYDEISEHALRFDDDGIPILGEYVFGTSQMNMTFWTMFSSPSSTEQNNPFLSHPSPLAQAKELLSQNGSLTEAALLLEAAIQKNDLGTGGYEAWVLLGETWSMDEREEAAMRALDTGVRIAQEAGGNALGVGMVSLAISYTNESYEKASYQMLLRWLRVKYPAHTPPVMATPGQTISSWALRDQATEAYLAVAREQYGSGSVDPDVQVGLGVLLYTSGDFDRAKDCFESALLARPTVRAAFGFAEPRISRIICL